MFLCVSNGTEPDQDVKARAVDEMMERIKKGIVLRPTNRVQVETLCPVFTVLRG